MTHSRVFAIQVPAYRDVESGSWVDKYDLSDARRFGELIQVLDYGNVPKDPGPTKVQLHKAFKDFDFASDSVLLLGDPVAIAHAVNVLTLKRRPDNAPLTVLKWDRKASKYVPYKVG